MYVKHGRLNADRENQPSGGSLGLLTFPLEDLIRRNVFRKPATQDFHRYSVGILLIQIANPLSEIDQRVGAIDFNLLCRRDAAENANENENSCEEMETAQAAVF